MAFFEPEIVCRKHPNHKQQPGVCSCCLRERLSKLAGSSTSSSFSTSPVYYSSASSTYTSPSRQAGHRRIASDILDYSLSFAKLSISGLKKSRSVAFVARNQVEDVNRKKKGGFWSKLLLRSTGKKTRV